MKTILCFFLFPLIYLNIGTAKINNTAAINSLVKAEYAFAVKSEQSGIRDAFLVFLSDESIVFRPTPTNGKKWYANQSEISGKLTWYPILADISKAGDLGYTTGPWEYKTQNKNGEAVSAFGHYVSVWRRQQDGQWKVEIDVGISHPKPEKLINGLSVQNISDKSKSQKYNINIESEKSSLIKAENEFLKSSQTEGFLNAFKLISSTTVRLYRENNFPLIEKDQIYKVLPEDDVIAKWKAEDAQISDSGDLGYTYGIAEFISKTKITKSEHAEQKGYMRIWKKDFEGKWKIVLDIENPIPSPTDK